MPVHGQAVVTAADTARTYRHHLGLTASPQLDQFFTANRSLPIGLLYRRQTRPNRAWRARGAVQTRYFKQEAPLFIGTAYTERTVNLEAAVGQERWFALSQKFTLFAGAEVGAQYEAYRRDSKDYEPGTPVFGVGVPPNTFTTGVGDEVLTNKTIGVVVRPVAGLRYFFAKRFYTEVETSLSLHWVRREFRLNGTYYALDTGISLGRGASGNNTYYTFK